MSVRENAPAPAARRAATRPRRPAALRKRSRRARASRSRRALDRRRAPAPARRSLHAWTIYRRKRSTTQSNEGGRSQKIRVIALIARGYEGGARGAGLILRWNSY